MQRRFSPKTFFVVLVLSAVTLTWRLVQPAQGAQMALEPSFETVAKPFFQKNCFQCHNADNQVSGVRVDFLNAAMEDRHLKLWEAILHRVGEGSMPPKGMPQPTEAERKEMVEWTTRALSIARSRPTPKNGLVRRLTISQYRNTLRELLQLEDDLTESLPPEAVSKDGFVNNKETLQLNPLLTESYFEIAEEALNRSIVDPQKKPAVQSFRVDLGASINPAPFPEDLILGANSTLLDNKDYTVTQLTPVKPFPVAQKPMRTNYRFIEGYAGNATVRGWRDYSSIYHSVFACMRGKGGYPKGDAYSTVQGALLLRPAIPSDELFGSDGTYGPRANFKISLRELPDYGRFRVTVTAAKYIDGLMIDPGVPAQAEAVAGAVVVPNPQDKQTVTIPKAGIYQVDIHNSAEPTKKIPVETSRLRESLGLALDFEDQPRESPFGKAYHIETAENALSLPRTAGMNVGDGDFTVAAWIKPKGLRKTGLLALGTTGWGHGWFLEMPDNRGVLRFESSGPDGQSNGSVSTPPGTLKNNTWSHVAVVVKRGKFEGRIFVNGFAVGRGEVYNANLDNPKMDLHLGKIPGTEQFYRGELDEVRIYRRALGDPEIQGLVEPGRQFAQAPPERPQEGKLTLGGREFSGMLPQPAFVVVRLPAGPLAVKAETSSLMRGLDRVVLTPLAAEHSLAAKFAAFEKRNPHLGVHLGFRRDCGSTFAPVDTVKTVSSDKPGKFVFEG
ncbi:MAG: DUF1587 domain-containing protein, partial [Acidobacteria bacterium]|nr:DUF1587 domain-containing protein [Acidobacteriota bacterium]